MKSLVDAGHDVTMVTPFARELANENYTSFIDLSGDLPLQISSVSYKQHTKPSGYEAIHLALHYEKHLCDKVFNSEAFQVDTYNDACVH